MWLTAVALTALLFAGILGIQTSQVQTYLSKKFLDKLENLTESRIDYEKVHIKPFNTLVLKNVTLVDTEPCNALAPDTLFRAEYVIARFTLRGLRQKEGLHIRSALVRNAEMNLVVEPEKRTNLQRMFGIKKNPNKVKKDNNVFDIRRAEIDGMTFRLKNYRHPHDNIPPTAINWSDLEVRDIKINARNLKLKGGVMSGKLDFLSFNEKSGYNCTSLSGRAKVGRGLALIEDLKIKDPWSDVDIPTFSMSYSNAQDFKDFVNKVVLYGDIAQGSLLSMKTLSYFIPRMGENLFRAAVEGKVNGPVSGLSIEGLNIDATDGSIAGEFDGRITGLPKTEKMVIDMKLKGVSLSTEGIEKFLGNWTKGKVPELKKYAAGTVFRTNGSLKGTLNHLNIDLDADSEAGGFSTSLLAENLTSKTGSITMDGILSSKDLDLGNIMGVKMLGPCTMKAGLSADLGNRGEAAASLRIDSLIVDRLNMLDYDYGNIAAAGEIAREAFNGKIICNDPNLNFMFQGMFNLSRKTSNAVYRFYLNVGYADLNAMNLDRRGLSQVSFRTSANFNRIRKGDLLGDINVADVILQNSAGKYDIGDIGISSFSNNNINRMTFSSGFAEGNYTGTAPITKFFRDFTSVTLKKEIPSMFVQSESSWEGDRYDLTFTTHNTMDLLSFLAPGVYIADSTALKVKIDTSGVFTGGITSQRIAFKEQYIRDIECSFDNRNSSLNGELRSENMRLAGMTLKNNNVVLYADDDHLGVGFSYDNESTLTNRGEFFVTGDVSRDEKMRLDVNILPSSLYLNAREWSVEPSSLSIYGKEISVENLSLRSGDQAVRIYGEASETEYKTLNLALDRFDISIINPLIKKDLGIEGALTGTAGFFSPYSDYGLAMDFLCDSTKIVGEDIGTLTVRSSWDTDFKRLGMEVQNHLEGRPTFDIRGNFTPRDGSLDAEAVLDRLNLAYAAPFVESIFSELNGNLSGKINIERLNKRFNLSTEALTLENAGLRIGYTNVPYRLNGGLHADQNGVYFDSIRIEDRRRGRGEVRGSIDFEDFRNMRFNTDINVRNMECIDIAEKDAAGFYGNLSATGTVSLRGPANSLLMTVDATTDGDGQFNVPISSSSSATASGLLTFWKPEVVTVIDPYEAMVSKLKEKEKRPGNFAIKLRVAATPDVEAHIEIDKATGNVLTGRGNGIIDIDVQPQRNVFNLNGDYTIESGSYRFVALGIATRDFNIQEGSSIKFNGDIMESVLDIDAIYRTKASLSALIADTTSVSNRRTVECGIAISDKLSNPRINLSIDIPDLDPTVQSRVESALSTEDKVQKQFLSLLISNSFLPDEQSGIVNNNTILYSNVTDIMTNQLNNIFQKLNIPLDLGLSYQPTDQGNDIFDVAVSTQLFNNRVIVNGNIGNRQYTSSSSGSNVVGDLDIEIKLTRNGALRLNLFSHSADEYTNYLDNSQRNGIGLGWQKEFDRFDTFFKTLFQSKAKREEEQLKEVQQRQNQEMNVLKIENGK